MRILARRGYRGAGIQQVAWYAGLGLMAVALLSPLDSLGETDLLSAHMAQHLLIADLSAPLLVIGLRSPVYAFILPRALFAELARSRRLRAAFRFLKQPLVAAPIWIAVLYGWHLAPAYEAALRSPVLHALQHQTFIAASILAVGGRAGAGPAARAGRAVEDPAHRGHAVRGDVPGDGVRDPPAADLRGLLRQPGPRARPHAREDQQIAGGMMLRVDFLVMIGALVFFFFRAADDADRKQDGGGSRRAGAPGHRLSPGGEVGLG